MSRKLFASNQYINNKISELKARRAGLLVEKRKLVFLGYEMDDKIFLSHGNREEWRRLYLQRESVFEEIKVIEARIKEVEHTLGILQEILGEEAA